MLDFYDQNNNFFHFSNACKPQTIKKNIKEKIKTTENPLYKHVFMFIFTSPHQSYISEA